VRALGVQSPPLLSFLLPRALVMGMPAARLAITQLQAPLRCAAVGCVDAWIPCSPRWHCIEFRLVLRHFAVVGCYVLGLVLLSFVLFGALCLESLVEQAGGTTSRYRCATWTHCLLLMGWVILQRLLRWVNHTGQ
jgi:hypothetical protein